MNPPRVQFNKNSEERKDVRIKILFFIILFLLVVFAAVVAFLRNPKFQIENIAIDGAQAIDPQRVARSATEYITGNYLWIIPKTNTLLFSKRGLTEFLLNTIPSLSNVEVSFVDKNNIKISIFEKKPKYVWCEQSCYFVDETGMLYDESPQFTPGVFITFRGTSAGTILATDSSMVKQRFSPSVDFLNMDKILLSLSKYPVHIIGVDYLTTATEVGMQDISIQVDRIKDFILNINTKILITDQTSAESITESLDLILGNKVFSDALRSKGNTLEYIDLRFPGKIYYKFANTAQVNSEVSEPETITSQ